MGVDILPLVTSIVTFYGIYLILALSFNIEYGFAGQPNFGKVFFYSIGAYVAGCFTANMLMKASGVTGVDFCSDLAAEVRFRVAMSKPWLIIALFLISLLMAAVIGGAFGYLTSYPALRLSGDFLAIVLLAFGEISRVFARNYTPLVCGVYGLSGVPNPLVWIGDPRAARLAYSAIVLAIAFLMYLLAERLMNSPYGRLLKSIRDDELVSNVMGKVTPRVKGSALIVGSSMAAVAGALYAFYIQTVIADDFIPIVTFVAITMVMLGGVANNKGTLLGAMVMTLMDRLTRASFLRILGISVGFDISYVRYIVTGLLIILILMVKSEGLIPEKPLKTPAIEEAERLQ